MKRRDFSKNLFIIGIGAHVGLVKFNSVMANNLGDSSSNNKKTLKQRYRDGDPIKIFRVPSHTKGEGVKKAIKENRPDLIYIDSQHEPYCDWTFNEQCAAAEELKTGVLFRIPHLSYTNRIGRFLDQGALAIKVPDVQTPEQVKEALDSFYYPPIGIRSWGNRGYNIGMLYTTGRVYSQLKYEDKKVYTNWFNQNGVIGFKIEHVSAVLRVKELALPGVDYFDFGTSDLSFDLDVQKHPDLHTLEDCKAYVKHELKDTDVRVFY